MSNGREFQRTEAATGNERRPTVDRYRIVSQLVVKYGCVHIDPFHCKSAMHYVRLQKKQSADFFADYRC